MDPYEEERHARFVAPIDALLTILDQVSSELVSAKASRSPENAQSLYDGALDLLFNCISLANPLAFRRVNGSRDAFMWPHGAGTPEVAFCWLVSDANGRCRRGQERTQRECEQTVARLLRDGI